ncbi:DUF4118 domain-containing protein [Robbsia sp. Bb-Pol-6]|uniref:DUF4118 domain-containing protein n=1 Tax=Robbsia betulipollinis TaxID=2981849 RepID=A0ABT3ZTP5_9BURK|nr:DUF4118 domain-containing protein [Robbsia betulipollinis]MCY0389238.1 DUF4118 domain-containing protein [Robbsia betulipollinis]
MKVQNARRWAPTGPRAWLFAALSLLLASAVRGSLHPVLGPASPGFAFCIAAALIEYFFGLAPALTVMTVGLVIADYLFVPPYGDLTYFDRSDVTLLVTYPLITIVVIVLIERLRRAQYRSELVASVAQCRYEILLRSDNERLLARRHADETHRLLRELTHRRDQLVFIRAVNPTPLANDPAAVPAIAPEVVPGTRPATRSLGNGLQAGDRFDAVHPADIERVLTVLTPGAHRVRLLTAAGDYRLTDALCERFTTPAGDFFILRLEA